MMSEWRRSFYDNCFYASEMTEEQRSLEEVLKASLGGEAELADRYQKFVARFEREPQRTTHLGVRLPSEEVLEAVLARLDDPVPELAGRVRVARVIRPGEPGSLAPNLIQAFVRTDVCAAGLVCLGQHFELQVQLES